MNFEVDNTLFEHTYKIVLRSYIFGWRALGTWHFSIATADFHFKKLNPMEARVQAEDFAKQTLPFLPNHTWCHNDDRYHAALFC